MVQKLKFAQSLKKKNLPPPFWLATEQKFFLKVTQIIAPTVYRKKVFSKKKEISS